MTCENVRDAKIPRRKRIDKIRQLSVERTSLVLHYTTATAFFFFPWGRFASKLLCVSFHLSIALFFFYCQGRPGIHFYDRPAINCFIGTHFVNFLQILVIAFVKHKIILARHDRLWLPPAVKDCLMLYKWSGQTQRTIGCTNVDKRCAVTPWQNCDTVSLINVVSFAMVVFDAPCEQKTQTNIGRESQRRKLWHGILRNENI